jgi:DNA-binding transcriptional LysR family regulator
MQASLEQYRVFLETARSKSFTRAAERLYITQPAVSQAIRQLEETLDVKLFVRTPRGATLTGEGELLYRYVEGAMGLLEGAEERFAEMRALEQGTLRLGASDTMCRHFLLEYLKDYKERYPGVNIAVTNRTSTEMADLIYSGRVELGFANLPLGGIERFEVSEAAQISDCFVCGEAYFDRFQSPISLDALVNERLIMLEQRSMTRQYLDQFFMERGILLRPQIELGSMDLLLDFAVAGLGIAATAAEYAASYIKQGKLRIVEVTTEIPKRSIGILRRKDLPLSFPAKAFMKLLEEKPLRLA